MSANMGKEKKGKMRTSLMLERENQDRGSLTIIAGIDFAVHFCAPPAAFNTDQAEKAHCALIFLRSVVTGRMDSGRIDSGWIEHKSRVLLVLVTGRNRE